MKILVDKKVVNYVLTNKCEGIALKRELQSFG